MALAALPLVAIPGLSDTARPSVRAELRVLRRPMVAATLLVAVLVNAGTFSAYTYLGALLTGPGAASSLVPITLAVFGIGAFLGVSAAARVADTHYCSLLLGGGAALLGGWAAMALASEVTALVVVLAGFLGLVAFAVGSAVIGRSLALVTDAPTLGGSFTTAALNICASTGPLAGGAAIATEAAGPVWVALAAVALAAIPAGCALRLETAARRP